MRFVLPAFAVASLALSACGASMSGPGSRTLCDEAPIDAGAGNGIERLGAATICFAAENDVEGAPAIDESRLGLTLVAEDARTEPPERFRACAAGVAETAELIDADGERLWLGIDAHYGANELVPRGLLQLIDSADLQLRRRAPFGRSLAITNGARLVVAMEVNGRIAGPFGSLVVENAGGSAPAAEGFCGPETPIALNFDGRTAANGDDAGFTIGGREFVATNIHSVDLGETECEDTLTGIDATWVVIDHSL